MESPSVSVTVSTAAGINLTDPSTRDAGNRRASDVDCSLRTGLPNLALLPGAHHVHCTLTDSRRQHIYDRAHQRSHSTCSQAIHSRSGHRQPATRVDKDRLSGHAIRSSVSPDSGHDRQGAARSFELACPVVVSDRVLRARARRGVARISRSALGVATLRGRRLWVIGVGLAARVGGRCSAAIVELVKRGGSARTIAKYIPGGVWQASGQLGLARSAGVQIQRSAVAFTVQALMQAVAACTFGAVVAVTWTDGASWLRVLLALASVFSLALVDRRWMVWTLHKIPRTRMSSDLVLRSEDPMTPRRPRHRYVGIGYLIVLGSFVRSTTQGWSFRLRDRTAVGFCRSRRRGWGPRRCSAILHGTFPPRCWCGERTSAPFRSRPKVAGADRSHGCGRRACARQRREVVSPEGDASAEAASATSSR
jgi:hypothetical protein